MTARPPLDSLPTVSPSKLSHIVLRSRNVPEAKKWWMTVLKARDIMEGMKGPGGVVPDEAMRAAGLTYDDEHHRVLILPMAPNDMADIKDDHRFTLVDKAQKLPGLVHVAFTHGSLGQLLATYKRLAAEEIEPSMCVNHGGTMSMYYTDPDGNTVELLVDTMPMDVATEFMHSEAFLENPIGYPWEPAEFCERYEAGEPLRSLITDGWDYLKQVEEPA